MVHKRRWNEANNAANGLLKDVAVLPYRFRRKDCLPGVLFLAGLSQTQAREDVRRCGAATAEGNRERTLPRLNGRDCQWMRTARRMIPNFSPVFSAGTTGPPRPLMISCLLIRHARRWYQISAAGHEAVRLFLVIDDCQSIIAGLNAAGDRACVV